MKALSVFPTLFLALITAVMINFAAVPEQSGRSPKNAVRGPAPTLTRPATPVKDPDGEGFIRGPGWKGR